jgi:excisionase family DNA binding protein
MQQAVEMSLVTRLDPRAPDVRSAARAASHRDKTGGLELVMNAPTARCFRGVEEFARICGISRYHAYELLARGTIPSRRLGRRLLIPVSFLEDLDNGPGGESA